MGSHMVYISDRLKLCVASVCICRYVQMLNYMPLDFCLNFNGLTTTYNFNCITYVNHMGSHIVLTYLLTYLLHGAEPLLKS